MRSRRLWRRFGAGDRTVLDDLLSVTLVAVHSSQNDGTHWRGNGQAEESDESSESLDLHCGEYQRFVDLPWIDVTRWGLRTLQSSLLY